MNIVGLRFGHPHCLDLWAEPANEASGQSLEF